MRKALLILALLSSLLGAKAQQNEAYTASDTLTMQQLMADYVSLNNQTIQFRNYELTSIGLGTGAGLLAVGAYLLVDPDDMTPSYAMLAAAGIAGVASLVTSIVGYSKLKRDRLEITPKGIIIKLQKKKDYYNPDLKNW